MGRVAVETVRRTTTGRLRGVDAARGLALFGMMSVHLLPAVDDEGDVTTAFLISAGRASALFALLAGVGLALANGGTTPPKSRELAGASRAIVGRALVLLVVGLVLGALDPPVAVILPYYAVLFLVAIPVLGLRAPGLTALALTAALFAPVLSQAIRPDLARPPSTNPDFSWLSDPAEFLTTVTVTGYYPVLTWTAYLFAGLAVGRLALRSARVAATLLFGGLALAVAATLLSQALLDGGARAELLRAGVGDAWIAGTPLDLALDIGFYGTTPTTSWWWLVIDAPHSGTTFDLLRTTGSSLAVLGVFLLLLQHSGRLVALLLAPLAAAGSMTLTLYSVHVFAVSEGWWGEDPSRQLTIHIVLALVIATLWRTFVGRGPLEALAATVARAFRGTS